MNLFDFESDEQQIQAIRAIITSDAWNGFFVVKLLEAKDAAIHMLLNPSESRKAEMSDDFLRARVTVLDELLSLGPSYVKEWDYEQAPLERAEAYQQSLNDRSELGHVGPLPPVA